ncbi:hypothetical protein BDR26DRAFT_914333 [Obelidium mucronatum]|nr:hypothetical protein BDR26DRAFT_914333 [Obelidium mucronatum]
MAPNVKQFEITGAVLLKVSSKLRSVRIQAELRGLCDTRWETNIKLATKLESDNYSVTHSSRVFVQLVEVVYEGTVEVNVTGDTLALPFSFTLPRNGLPPTFSSVGGAIQYYIKCSMLFQEGLKLLIPKRILSIGDRLEVDVGIHSIPADTRLRVMHASLRPMAAYSNKSAGAHAIFPRPLAEINETFPLIHVNEPIVRRFHLEIDPELALASFESALISVKTIFRLHITLDDSETPNVAWEAPIVVVPLLNRWRNAQISATQQVNNSSPNIQRHRSNELIGSFRPSSQNAMSLPVNASFTGSSPSPTGPPKFGPRSDSFNALRGQQISSLRSPSQQVPVMARSKTARALPSSRTPSYPPNTQPQQPSLPPTYSTAIASGASKFDGLLVELDQMQQLTNRESFASASESDFSFYFSPQAVNVTNQHEAMAPRAAVQQESSSVASSISPSISWTSTEVSEWLKTLGATSELSAVFLQEQIDGAVLKALSEKELRNDLGVTQLGNSAQDSYGD